MRQDLIQLRPSGMNNYHILELKDVGKSYQLKGQRPVKVFQGVNLKLKSSEIVGIVAPSGSGKTTLLNIAGLLDSPSSGSVVLMGKEFVGAKTASKNSYRRANIGFVFQYSNLINEFSALENAAVSGIIKGHNFKDATNNAKRMLIKIGLSDRLQHRPHELSGGEQQRVAICRALAHSPKLVLADEPTGNLDQENSEQIFELFKKLVKINQASALVVTHNIELIKKMDRVMTTTRDGLENG